MEEDPRQDLNPSVAAMLELNHAVLGAERGLPSPCDLGSRKARCSSHAELSLSGFKGCRRIPQLAMRMRFWIKNGSLAELQTCYFLFLRYGTPDWPGLARGGRTVCVGGCFKRILVFNGNILPLF